MVSKKLAIFWLISTEYIISPVSKFIQTSKLFLVIKNKFFPETIGCSKDVIAILKNVEPVFESNIYKYKSVETIIFLDVELLGLNKINYLDLCPKIDLNL